MILADLGGQFLCSGRAKHDRRGAVIDGASGTARDGTVRFRYANRTGVLRLGTTAGNLHFYDVRGCFGLIHSGDSAAVSATYTVTPRQTITSP